MSLALSSCDLERLADVQNTLLSPFDYDSTEKWLLMAVRQIKELIGADAGGIQGLNNRFTASSDYTDDLDNLVRDLAKDLDGQFNVTPRLIALGAWNRRLAYRHRLGSYYRSVYYNELITPYRMFDSVGLSVSRDREPSLNDSIHLVFHHDRPTGRRFGRRGIQLLRLLYPAFRAGIEAATRLEALQKASAGSIDALGHMFRVYDQDGDVVYQSSRLTDFLEDESSRPLDEMLERWAVWLKTRERGEAPVGDVTEAVEAGCGKMFIRTIWAPAGFFGREACLVVLVEGTRGNPPEALRDRYGLTERETHIAALLGARHTNMEIAGALAISEHTARHHTERVLHKLGVHSRREVASRLK